MLRQVAAGIDGSPESLAAAHWAAREALRRGAVLCLVHAGDGQPRPASSVAADVSGRAGAEDLPARVADSVRAAHPGLRVVGQAVAQAPVTALLAAAERSEPLVLGSCGLGGLAGFLVGSVARQVVARAAGTVVLVRAGECAADEHFSAPDGISPEEIPEIPYRDVVLGLDVGGPCDELIAFAFEAALRRHASLRVVHAFSASPGDTEPLAEHEHAMAAALGPWSAKYPGVDVARTVVEGTAGEVLARASDGAALLAVGRVRTARPGSRPGPHLGSVAHTLLRHASCPVAVVPHA